MISREEVQKIVAAQLKQAKGATVKSDGDKPYSSFHDQVAYPKGYNVPKFKQFNGLGNPDQHLAHFITACGDTSNNPSLLLRQFAASLTGVAFEWYANLQPESIQTWQQMKDSFRVRFGGVTDKITIADLANTRQNRDEKVIDYVMRWRNLSIKCEQPLDQVQAVGLLVGNIDNWMAPFLSSSDIHTFQDLISQVKKLERTSPKVVSTMQPTKVDKEKPRKPEGVKHVAFATNQAKETTAPANYNKSTPPSLGSGSEPPKPISSLQERMSKKYSFRRDKVIKIFKDALKVGLQLPESKRPEEADKKDHPNFCPYRRILGHSIENCYVFKDWIERQYQEGKITLSKNVLLDQPAEHTNYVSVALQEEALWGQDAGSTSEGMQADGGSQIPKEPALLGVPKSLWEIFISKKSRKMLKKLGELPGIKWRRAQEPDEKPKQKAKKNKKIKNKEKKQKQIKPAEFHHKKSIIEEYIDSLEDYQQKERALITLGDYFPGEVKELLSDLDESQDEEPMVETCLVITIYEEETWDDVDDEDEFELYYPDDGDSSSEQLYD
ncbi:Retrotransposon gag domain-containing protein [Dioscorea alata]|uniref:Retrotransposon gag domain-containing protein n=1 Tax=Dioscorea alata TaxID=55571 RepID=A0ACB7WKZ5_DIOAL|nr:Retrotransposon gag domain-containing protein [Dioscorea alata]